MRITINDAREGAGLSGRAETAGPSTKVRTSFIAKFDHCAFAPVGLALRHALVDHDASRPV